MNDARAEHDEHFRPHLRWRTALAGTIIFFVPFGLFLALVNSTSERHMHKEVYTRLAAGVETNVRLVDDVLVVRRKEAQSLARRLQRLSSAPRQWSGVLAEAAEGSPWWSKLMVADASGQVVASSGDARGNIGEWDSFRRALGGSAAIGVAPAPPTEEPEMVVALPLLAAGGQTTFVLVGALRSEKLSSRLLNLGICPGEDSFLVDPAGQFMSVSRSGRPVRTGPAFDPRGANPFQEEAGTGEYRDSRGQDVLCAYRKLRTKDYYLVIQVPRAEIAGQIRELRRIILLYVAPFLGLGVALAIVVWHYGTNYIDRLTRELWEALQVARQRERERDLAHQELARRFEEERELARQKEQFHAQLTEYEKYAALAQLALGAAHEINNPLLGILSHLELEQKVAKDAEEREEIAQCIEGAKRIASTVSGLIRYARPGPPQLSHVNLDRLVSDTLGFLRHQPLFRNVKFEKKIPGDLPFITADANQLSQMLMNLLLNAAEAMPEGGTVVLAAQKVKFSDQVEISVADTGCGIAADILPRIFEPFFTTKRGKGTGLGLSITRSYVRNHGGDIQVESIPQRGTTVRITLPIRQEGRGVAEVEEVIA